MQSAQTQILLLLAGQRIDVAEAERLLTLVRGRDRFLALAFWTILFVAAATACFPHSQLAENLYTAVHSTFQSVIGSEAFRNLHIFIVRILGELP